MKISKKLFYLNLGLIITLVLLCLVNVAAVQREHTARAASAKAAQAAMLGESVRYELMQNRLHLSNYLLSGDGRELQSVEEGVAKLQNDLHTAQDRALNEAQHGALARLHDTERDWEDRFLQPLVAKRKDVDNGKATVADLQIFYLQQNPNQWTRTAAGYLDEAEIATTRLVAEQHAQDASAGNVTITVALVGTFLAILFGLGISYKTSRSITIPLEQLIKTSREIGETGDLA